MALPDSFKQIIGTEIVVADSLYVPTEILAGARTHDIDMKDLAAGLAREGAKINFGTNMDLDYVLAAVIEWETTPEIAAGETVEFYMGWSRDADPGDSSPAALTGVDADYTGMAGGTLAGSLKLLHFLGAMTMDNVINTDTIGIQYNPAIRTFRPRAQYGIPVVVNNAAAAAFHSDAVEMAIVFTPLITQIQD